MGWAKPDPPTIDGERVSVKAHRVHDMLMEQDSLSVMSVALLFCVPLVSFEPAPGLLKKFVFPFPRSTYFLATFLFQNTIQDLVLSRSYVDVVEEDLMYCYRYDGPARRMKMQEVACVQWTLQQLLRVGWFFHYMQIGNFAENETLK